MSARGAGRVLLITKRLEEHPKGGREMLCRLNHDALRQAYGERLLVFPVDGKPLRPRDVAAGVFRGHIDGLSAIIIDHAVDLARRHDVRKVFVDGSNLGAVVAALKTRRPEVEVSTFFHNVEARFFWGALKARRSVRAAGVLLANYLAERRAVRQSDKLVCLSDRDSRVLQRVYGRPATHISPLALVDRASEACAAGPAAPAEPFALFVGGTFYANRTGITWYASEVAPRSPVKVLVVGKGFESLRPELEVAGKVQVVGTVPSLADWYRRAQFVIAPIFDGSGMKTKVAEALMFGKKVVGTPEAFSGYESVAAEAGWVCRTPEDFLAAMGQACSTIRTSFDPRLRALYVSSYSLQAAQERLHRIMES